MIEWRSSYNYDFAISSIPIQIILLVFYCSRRNLPVRQSGSFLYVMFFNMTMTASDIIACELNEVWTEYPLWVMYLINIGYFIGFLMRGWALFDYTAEGCRSYLVVPRRLTQILAAPVIAMCLITISTPWTGILFRFEPGSGYQNNPAGYPGIYFSTWFYIIASLIYVLVSRKKCRLRFRIAMYGYNAILIAGILSRSHFPMTLVTSYFSILAVLIIYLSAQNPDLYRDQKVRLFNRDAFEAIVEEFIGKKEEFSCFGVSFRAFDTDRAVYGEENLKEAIRQISQFLQSIPGYDPFYFGRGTFILLEHTHREECRILDHAIRERFKEKWTVGGNDLDLNICTYFLPRKVKKKSAGFTIDCLIRAEEDAREHGGRSVYTVGEGLLGRMRREEEVGRAVGRAINGRRFEVYLQPLYSVREKRIVAAEALARLTDPEVGPIPPPEFIQVSEKNGQIMEVGRQIFEKTCALIRDYDLEKLGIHCLNVNLSPIQCMNDNLAQELIQAARRYGISMEQICLEITESTMEDIDVMRKQMERLGAEGVSFSLDDFGTGTSNITRLLGLPLRSVKLDMTVVWSYFRKESRILRYLLQMFVDSEFDIIVEGVENREMAEELARLGADVEQGYYFSKPLSPEDFIQYVEDFERIPEKEKVGAPVRKNSTDPI